MRTITGAASVILVGLALWLAPPARDPAVLALPLSLRLTIDLAIVTMGAVGILLFIFSVVSEMEGTGR